MAALTAGCGDDLLGGVSDILVDPDSIDFETVTMTSEERQPITVTNVGIAPLELRSIELVTADGAYTLQGIPEPAPTIGTPIVVNPNQSFAFDVTFAPKNLGDAEGAVIITSNAGFSPVVTVPLTGLGLDPSGRPMITVSPAQIDFGRLDFGQNAAERITVISVGAKPLSLDSFNLDSSSGDFSLSGEMVTQLQPGQRISLRVDYTPTTLGSHGTRLVIESNAVNLPSAIVPLRGDSYSMRSDTFTQESAISEADLLFVVDDSISMGGEQDNLSTSFETFANWMGGYPNLDLHIAVTTTDTNNVSGGFVGSPKVIDSTTTDIIAAFQANVAVGTNGDPTEKGFLAAQMALSEPLLSGANAGFLRDNARLYLVFVSDEDDQSTGTAQSYVDFFTQLKGGDASQVFYAAIATDEAKTGCPLFSDNKFGDRYKEITDLTAGLFENICQEDFGVPLQNLAFEVTSVANEFPLSGTPVPSTIEISIDGAITPGNQWNYVNSINAIAFEAGAIPNGGAVIKATYELAILP